MSIESVIAAAIRKAAKAAVPVLITEGTVTSIDREARTCDVERENRTELFNVRLNAFLEAGTDVITVYPKQGSNVLCAIIENDPTDAYILDTTDIEEISGQIGDIKLKWTSEGIVFNDGSIGGLVKGTELKTQLDKLTARVDAIIDAIKNAKPATDQSGAGLQTTIVAALELISDKEDFKDIENPKVKH